MKFFSFGIVIVLLSLSGTAQNYNLLWDETYGGESRDWNGTISSNNSGEIFIISDSQSEVSGNKTTTLCNGQVENADIWLIKIDTSGAIIWQQGYGGEADERAPELIHLNNPAGEMIFGCYSTSDIACEKTGMNRDTIAPASSDYWLCKLDNSGSIIWDVTIGGDNFDDYTKIAGLPNGELIVAGESNSPVGFDKTVPNYTISNDFWALKLNASGAAVWDNVYGGDGGEFLATVITNNDGTFLLAGSTNSDISGDVSESTQGNYDYWMIKVDATGNKIWDKRFGGTGPDRCNYAAKTSDGGYILCGFTVSPQSGDVSEAPKGFQDYWVVKTDAQGNKLWDKRFGGSGGSFATFVEETSGGYWIAGYSNSNDVIDVTEPSYGGSDYWILKINTAGDKIWDKRFGGTGDEYNASLLSLADSSMMVFGYSDSSGTNTVKSATSRGWFDNWLVKFSYTDSTTSISNIANQEYDFRLYPNPTSEMLNIQLYNTNGAHVLNNSSISITDMVGRTVYHMNAFGLQMNEVYQINTSSFSKGSYLLSIRNEYNIIYKEVITVQ